MKLIKDKEVIELPNVNHAEAFMDNGWKIYEEAKTEEKPKKEIKK